MKEDSTNYKRRVRLESTLLLESLCLSEKVSDSL